MKRVVPSLCGIDRPAQKACTLSRNAEVPRQGSSRLRRLGHLRNFRRLSLPSRWNRGSFSRIRVLCLVRSALRRARTCAGRRRERVLEADIPKPPHQQTPGLVGLRGMTPCRGLCQLELVHQSSGRGLRQRGSQRTAHHAVPQNFLNMASLRWSRPGGGSLVRVKALVKALHLKGAGLLS